MKRLIISLTIMVVIIAMSVYALYMVSRKNDRLYGHIEAVVSAYEQEGDVDTEIRNLREYFEKDYVPKLGCFVDDDLLHEISALISRLEPMYAADCDEFTAECEAIRAEARKIYLNELPVFFRIM